MEIRVLRYFFTVVREESVTKAADVLAKKEFVRRLDVWLVNNVTISLGIVTIRKKLNLVFFC